MPRQATPGAAGFDLSAVGEHIVLPGERKKIPTGWGVRVRPGLHGQIWPRSGLADKLGIDTLAGLIDPDYQGEIKVILLNTGDQPFRIEHGDRIAQLVICGHLVAEPCEVVEVDVAATVRGAGGFGSTGTGVKH
ncbi:hypothetical protein BJP27_24325 (plasmid) [Pseudomonas oryzihabitans]|nr:hypothetical protein BJP27_24325 [Pseudomonas psychrotolerans]